jgi:hypothetical protein
MKICFDFICDEALIFSSVASVLEKKNYKVTGITLGADGKKAGAISLKQTLWICMIRILIGKST